jgi:spore coat polysaccharide biosynthesis predicted glycosyltransferase SpsG
MRCYALGQALERVHIDPVFVCDIGAIPWVGKLLGRFANVTPESADWNMFDAVVIDSYTVSLEQVQVCRERNLPVTVIADDATGRLPADLYIEAGVNLTWNPPEGFAEVPRLAGPSAVLLREEILRLPVLTAVPKEAQDRVRLLVALGGVDRPQYLQSILEAFSKVGMACDVRIVGTPLDQAPAPRNYTVEWRALGSDFVNLLASSDIVVCSAGVTCWETLSRGVPLGIIRTADNQEPNYSFLSGEAICVPLGRLDIGDEVNDELLADLLSNEDLRQQLGIRAQRLVDSGGADRAAKAIVEQLVRARSNRGVR